MGEGRGSLQGKPSKASEKRFPRCGRRPDRGDKRGKEERNGCTGGRTDGQTDMREGMKIIIPRVALGHKCQQGRKAWRKKRVEFVICKSRQPSPSPSSPSRTRVRNRRLTCRPRGLFREGFGNRGTEIRILCDSVAHPPRLSNPLFSRDCTGRENVSGVYRDTVTESFYRHPFESCVLRLYFFPFRRSASNFTSHYLLC